MEHAPRPLPGKPLFSVVIPVFNRPGLLAHALRSVLGQTYQDFEILVVDDGSEDAADRIIEELADPRIRFLKRPHRGGSAARNTGIDAAAGELIAFLDSDDRFLPHHLEIMGRLLAGRTRSAAYAPVIVDRGRGKTFLKPPRACRKGEDMADYLMCDRGFVPTSTLVVPADVARSVRYCEGLPFAQDTDFAIRLARAGCQVVMAPDPGSIWDDTARVDRVSAGRKGVHLIGWLESIRPQISSRAYYGYRGWAIAKSFALVDRRRAFRLYAAAVRYRCYRANLALIIFLQIFLSDARYRAMADAVVKWRIMRATAWLREKPA